MQLHANTRAQLAKQCVRGGVTPNTTLGDSSPNFEDYCRSDLLGRQKRSAWPEKPWKTPWDFEPPTATSHTHRSIPRQDALSSAGLSPPCNSICKYLCKAVCVPGMDRATGQGVGSGASLWHQNAPSINSNHSLASICELFFFSLNFLVIPFFPPSFIKKCVYVWRDRYLTVCWKTEK